MQVLPVLDILNGQVVRGVAGRRCDYRRIASHLTNSEDPIDVARAIRNSFDLEQFYIADLDAILTQRPNLASYRRLIEEGFELLVDAGFQNPDDVALVLDTGVTGVVVGLESCLSPNTFAMITACTDNVTFSLDLLNGEPVRPYGSHGWSDNPSEIIRQAVRANATAIIVLDLSDVGMGTGGSTDSLCRFILAEFPTVRLITGGGVRGIDDLNRLNNLGVDAVLVASALHDGRLARSDIRVHRTCKLRDSDNLSD